MRIELCDVRKRFGTHEALRGLTVGIPSGRRTALVGPNGSGKSTLIRALLGLLRVEGAIRLDGLCPVQDRDALAPRIAYVPQAAPRMAASVRELVHAVASVRGLALGRIHALSERLGLDLGAVAAKPFRDLSGGMKQKVLCALAFAADPSLLVLDEATASLDAEARERFAELVRELPETTTVLLCSHRIEEASRLASHTVALAEGRLVYDGLLVGWGGATASGEAAPVVVSMCVPERRADEEAPAWR